MPGDGRDHGWCPLRAMLTAVWSRTRPSDDNEDARCIGRDCAWWDKRVPGGGGCGVARAWTGRGLR